MPKGIYTRTEYHKEILRKNGFQKGHPNYSGYKFPKGEANLKWKGGISLNPDYDKKRSIGRIYILNKRSRERKRERDRIYVKTIRKEKRKQRRKIDFQFRLDSNMASSLWIALKGKKAGRKWESLVGY